MSTNRRRRRRRVINRLSPAMKFFLETGEFPPDDLPWSDDDDFFELVYGSNNYQAVSTAWEKFGDQIISQWTGTENPWALDFLS